MNKAQVSYRKVWWIFGSIMVLGCGIAMAQTNIASLPLPLEQTLEPVRDLLGWMLQYWYISVFIGLALLLGNRWFPYIALGILGFIWGMTIIFPWILTIPEVASWFTANPGSELPLSIVAGAATILIGFVLVRFLFILAGFIIGGLLGLWLWSILSLWIDPQWFGLATGFPEWLPWVFAAIVGVVIAILFLMAQKKTIALISVIVGSFMLSILFMNLLILYFSEWFGTWDLPMGIASLTPLGLGIFWGSFALFLVSGALTFRRKKEG